MAVEGPVIHWVADHRKHHAFTDVEGDPHSPHVGHGSGLQGLWHAHAGWLTLEQGTASPRRYAKDLVEDKTMRRISDAFPWLVLLSLGLPAALGFILHGFTIAGLLTGLLWGGLVRIFFVHHVTWSINSVCHFSGSRRFDVEDHSTNVAWLARAVVRRGLAPQPPRVPALGRPRPGRLGARARPLGLGGGDDGARRSGVERRADRARAAGRAARGCAKARPPAPRPSLLPSGRRSGRRARAF